MDSKYKARLFRAGLVGGALLLGWQASLAEEASARALLGLAGLWLLTTGLLQEQSLHWPALLPWQLVPGGLLAALLWVEPSHYGAWLWLWAILVMLPQPTWLLPLQGGLAALGWWRVQQDLIPEQGLLTGLLLAAVMLLGLGRALYLRPLWQGVSRRRRLLPGTRLWSRDQLVRDLYRERLRCERKDYHAELLLLRARPRHCWPLTRWLVSHLEPDENLYRLDRRTLATLLISRDAASGRQRRDALLAAPPWPVKARAIDLGSRHTLPLEERALAGQTQPLVTLPPSEAADHA
ncbi:hypothetical protein [Bisbaumannia pacifica]|uniref:Uncharacterized protein n=1 Tax=Bisbaumannia pacifica TaxID=77098 RepID=A0A510X9M4_9GAMM|nr:hypothetical protein [Halomonas pacifica]MBH8581813.1 hypothetical protein [Halomonas pacifica]GEK48138.1 hypothetical protein HPA02_24210 [Halomonas pacifica]